MHVSSGQIATCLTRHHQRGKKRRRRKNASSSILHNPPSLFSSFCTYLSVSSLFSFSLSLGKSHRSSPVGREEKNSTIKAVVSLVEIGVPIDIRRGRACIGGTAGAVTVDLVRKLKL